MTEPLRPFSGVPIRAITDVGHHACPLAFAIDPYAETCAFHCVYCYASGTKVTALAEADLEKLDGILSEALAGTGDTPWHDAFRSRTPLRIGYLRDPLTPEEVTQRMTRQLVQLLNRHRYPFIVFTKSAMVAEDDYPELMSGAHAAVQISFTSLDEQVAAMLEPRAPTARARLDALAVLCRRGVRAIARVNPLVRRALVRGVETDCFSLALLDEIRSAGSRGVIFGSLNRRGITDSAFLGLLPADSEEQHRAFIESVVERCRALGLEFTLCQLGPRPPGFPAAPGAKAGSCCQVAGDLVPFGVPTWTRLSCAELQPVQKASLFVAHELMKKIRD